MTYEAIYETNEEGRVRCGMSLTTNGIVSAPGSFMAEGRQLYVMVRPKNLEGQWVHPKFGNVDLCNVHDTGEVRWHVSPVPDPAWLNAPDREAVIHFGLHPRNQTAESWEAKIDETEIKWDDLSDVEKSVLSRLVKNVESSTVFVQSMHFTNEDGDKIHIIRNSKEVSALYDLANKGLAIVGSRFAGPGFFEMSHTFTSKVMGKPTKLGRKLFKSNN